MMMKNEPVRGEPHIVSYENTDRLKTEVAHHNPDNLDPNQMLNRILDGYFRIANQIRK